MVERYLTPCDTLYAEYLITDDGPELSGVGQLLMEPVASVQITHGELVTPEVMGKLLKAGERLTAAIHAMGYRGLLSTDALLTEAGEVVLTETNGRLSGSTHLHVVIDGRILRSEHRGHRVLLERFGWCVPSFTAAVERLGAAGLAFDRNSGTGVMITSDLMPDRCVNFCVVAEKLHSAQEIERTGSRPVHPCGRQRRRNDPALTFVQEYMK